MKSTSLLLASAALAFSAGAYAQTTKPGLWEITNKMQSSSGEMEKAMKPGAIFVDHTTASADVARELYAAAAKLGLQFIDAPVSGGQAGAQNGALTVMCGGDAAVFERIKPVAMKTLLSRSSGIFKRRLFKYKIESLFLH